MAASLGALAKEGSTLQSRLAGTTAKAKGMIVKGVLAKELATGLVTGAVLLVLLAVYLGLSKVMDPALAALIPGVLVLAALTCAAVVIGRPPR